MMVDGSAFICSARRFRGRGGTWLGGWVAGGKQHLPGAFAVSFAEFRQRVSKSFDAKIFLAFGAFHAVEERGYLDELETPINEIQVKHLLACHNSIGQLASRFIRQSNLV